MSKLAWSANDVVNTATHSYRVEQIGDSISVVYSKTGGQAFRYSGLDSVASAKQWAQNYHNEFGGDYVKTES